MKIVRLSIIFATLALAGLAGTSDRATLHGAACRLDGVARALSGGPSGGSCER
jgi:hypothetical protein